MRPRLLLRLTGLLVVLVAFGTAGGRRIPHQDVVAQSTNAISYIYDEQDRLVAVVDPSQTQGTAIYSYDAAGNITSISRQSAMQVAILQVTPPSAPVGSTVTIYGSGFSGTPGQNTVTFNGTAGTVTAATATQLVTTVPIGATTGTIAVSTPGGSATSPSSFIVGDVAAPTITSFNPTIGTLGAPVTITGTNYETVLATGLRFNGTLAPVSSASATALTSTVPMVAGSGHISVTTQHGTAVSAGDFFVPPSPYTAADVAFTGRIDVGGNPLTVTISAANKVALVLFDGTAGQQFGLGLTGVTIGTSPSSSAQVSVLKPDGSTLVLPTLFGTNGGDVALRLPVSGTYTIVIDPAFSATGNATLTLSQDVSASITVDGSAITAMLTRAGQHAYVTFAGTAGQQLGLGLTGVTIGTSTTASTQVSILKADGTTLVSPTTLGTTGEDISFQIPVDGTYSIFVDPVNAALGSITLTLSQDVSASITVDGSAITAMLTRAGQHAYVTFAGTAGQQLGLGLTGVTIGTSTSQSSFVSVRKPDGTILLSQSFFGTNGADYTLALPTTGTYTIFVDPVRAATGSVTLTLSQDVSASITVDGSAITAMLTRAGQHAYVTFAGTAGQQLGLGLTGVTIGTSTTSSATVSVRKPDGTTLLSSSSFGTNGADYALALPTTGTYTIFVDPNNAATGNVTLTLSQDVTTTIAIGGSAVTISLARAGQHGYLTFAGTTGQRLSLAMTGVTIGTSTTNSTQVSIRKPDGTNFVSPSSVGTNGRTITTNALPVDGTYTIFVDPNNAATGNMTLALSLSAALPSTQSDLLATDNPHAEPLPIALWLAGAEGPHLTATPGDGIELNSPEELSQPTPCPRGGCNPQPASPTPSATPTATSPVSCPRGGCTTMTPTPSVTAAPSATPTVTSTPTCPSERGRESCPTASPTNTPLPSASPTMTPSASPTPTPTPVGGTEPERIQSEDDDLDDEAWRPASHQLRGANWLSERPDTPFRTLPRLSARPGVTALSGQVLRLNGRPLRGVTLRVGEAHVQTDERGQFLLTDLPAGHQELIVDGRSASTARRVYGVFEAGVEITAGQTTVLPYIIWMPLLDTEHAVTLPTTLTSEVVVTTPLIPGLEVHIPAGTVIRDLDGNPVTQLSITPVPVDRPPFPLPQNVQVPLYFTLQPGGAYLTPPGARIIYPNLTHEPPGARIDFWTYDPDAIGWHVYGQGTVSADGKQVVPDPGVAIYDLSGAMIVVPGKTPPPTGPVCHSGQCGGGKGGQDGDPVDLGTGLFVLDATDLVVPDTLPITLTRTYRPADSEVREFGIGTNFTYGMFLWSLNNNYLAADLVLPDGGRVHYVRTSPGVNYWDAAFEHTTSPTIFYQSHLAWNGLGWDLTLKDGTVYVFGDNAPLQAIRDRNGNTITVVHASGQAGNITMVRSPNGRWVQFTYDASNRITQATDNIGRVVGYTYDANGRLWKVTNPASGVTEYGYDSANQMLTIKDARGITYLTNHYDSNGRLDLQTQADSSTYQFGYTLDSNSNVIQTDVTNPRGYVRRVTFNADGYLLSDTAALGQSVQQTTAYQRQSGSNLITSVTDPLGRRTDLTYDSKGNVITSTRLAGTANPVTTTYAYDLTYSQLTSITDPLSHTTTLTLDTHGNVINVTDPLGHTTAFTRNAAGQVTAITDALSHTTQITYAAGDLVAVQDALGNVVSRFVDFVGRVVETTDPLGLSTRVDYDALNQLVQVINPRGGVTAFAYDANGNRTSVTDPRNNATTYAYDAMDRVTSRTDPLMHTESYQYDNNGNRIQITDRKSQVTGITYDALDQPTITTFHGGATSTTTYDGLSLPTQVVDSDNGTITWTYDELTRLTSETSAPGSVSYTYDAADRLTSMTVAGQPAVTYSYDAADRPISITQGSSTVTVAYDNANRPTSVTLPSGVVVEYGYDNANRLTGLTYKYGTTTLGDLTYGYDAVGRRTSMGGSYARTGLPAALASATYNAANQLTQWGSTTLTYDLNGNLTSDGTRTFTWNSRDQLTAIGGAVTASFAYDAIGRRASKTIGGTATSFLYDWDDVVQELTGGMPSANLLIGGLDNVLTRTDGTGARTLLPDALGSTLGLVDNSGVVQTQYTYDPFGNTTVSGQADANPSQFTGRENDGTGLYYYRARYYHPQLGRFASEDPLGFAGGDLNLYGYAANNPTNLTDPSGEVAPFIVWAAVTCLRGAGWGVTFGLVDNVLSGRKTTISGVLRDAIVGCLTELAFGSAVKALGHIPGIGGLIEKALETACRANSFAGETLVATPDGERPISSIHVGDAVLAYDETTGKTGPYRVAAVIVGTDASVELLAIDGEAVETTANHPFLTEERGWVEAGRLWVGAHVRTASGGVSTVQSTAVGVGPARMYNLEVEGAHTFFVGSQQWLVHNACGSWAFHVLETEGTLVRLSVKHGDAEYEILTHITREGDTIILDGFAIGPGIPLGISGLREMAREFGRQQGATEVIVRGGMRSTGGGEWGRIPRDIRIPVR